MRTLRKSAVLEYVDNINDKQAFDQYVDLWIDRQLWDIEARRYVKYKRDLKHKIKDYKSLLTVREYQENFLFNKIAISENDVLDYYNSHTREFTTTEPSAYVDIYTCPTQSESNDVIASLTSSSPLAVSSKSLLVIKGTCVDPLDRAIFGKKDTGLLGPIKDQNNYYIAFIHEYYHENTLLRVEHVRNDIIQKLQMTERINLKQEKLKELKDRINVKIFKDSDR